MSRAAIYLQKKINEKAEAKTSHSCKLCDERVVNLCKLPLLINRRYGKTACIVQRCLDCMKIRINCPNNHPAPAQEETHSNSLTADTPKNSGFS